MRALISLIALSAAVPALAEPVPYADVDRLCRAAVKLDDKHGRSPRAQFDECFDWQQKAYWELVKVWGTMSADEQTDCAAMSHFYPQYVYSDLVECATKKREARQRAEDLARKAAERDAIPRREFRY